MRWIFGLLGALAGGVVSVLVMKTGFRGIEGQLPFFLGAIIGSPVGWGIGSAIDMLMMAKTPPIQTTNNHNPQVTGATCRKCGERILMASAGYHCKYCRNIFHNDCKTEEQCHG